MGEEDTGGVKRWRASGRPRSQTEALDRVSRHHLRIITSEADADERAGGEVERPKTRGDCENGLRPCPFVSCSMNLYLDVGRTGNIKILHPGREPEEVPAEESCALDIAGAGGATLQEIGVMMNFTRERSRQIEEVGLRKLGLALKIAGKAPEMRDALAAATRRGEHGTPLALAQEDD